MPSLLVWLFVKVGDQLIRYRSFTWDRSPIILGKNRIKHSHSHIQNIHTHSKQTFLIKNFQDHVSNNEANSFRIFAVPRQSSMQLLSFWSLWKGAPHQSDWNFASIETKTMIGCILEATFFDARTETDKSVVSLKHLQLNHWRMLKRRMI